MEPLNNRRFSFAFPSLTDFAHETVRQTLTTFTEKGICANQRLIAVDGTCGNGYDTLFLAKTLQVLLPDSKWRIIGVDIQPEAISSTRAALVAGDSLLDNVRLKCASHEFLLDIVSPEQGLYAVVMYNLGYLPRSDKTIITCAQSTLPSLESAAYLLAQRGVLCVHSYGGHDHGLEEMQEVDAWFHTLSADEWCVAKYEMLNKRHNPECLHLAQRKEKKL